MYQTKKNESLSHEEQLEVEKTSAMTAQLRKVFEDSVNLISTKVCSPIAKIIAYNQVITSIIPDFLETEADE